MRNLGILFLYLLSAAFSVPQVSAQTPPDSVTLYALGPKAAFEYGCFGPCACPVFSLQPVKGTFQLKHLGFDGLYDNYAVSNVQWTATDNMANLTITGSGQYRIGGEVAVQKQMTLDLRVGGRPTQHFDSGLIPGTYDFPQIEIDVSLHGMVCFDSVFHVQASPAAASVVSSVTETPRLASVRAMPNPFALETNVRVALSNSGRVDLTIFDTRGRLVRRLARGAWLPAGAPSVIWDGKRDDGRTSASGIYFLRARIDGQTTLLRLVKAR
jgi:hypothetical protein